MDDITFGNRAILVDDEVFDVLSRTAETRKSDINGALRHLILDGPAAAQPSNDEDEDEDGE
jgi:hypothetical protein